MIRLFFFFLTLVLVAIGSMWFIDNDGSIVIEWMGYRVQTSVAFASLASVIVLVFFAMLVQLLLWIKRTPSRYRKALHERKRESGLSALTKGFAAIAAGDTKEAKRLTKKAAVNLGPIPLTRLLSAQTAQMEGDTEQARMHYTAMLENKETELIAIKGLLLQARRENDLEKAIFLAEKALSMRDDADWAISILLDLYKRTRRWDKAEHIVHKAAKRQVITTTAAKRAHALILLARSRAALTRGDAESALSSTKEAYGFAPALVPAITLYSTALVRSGLAKKAAKILEAAWHATPHPDMLPVYRECLAQLPAEKALARMEQFVTQHDMPQAHLELAHVAIDHGHYSTARNHIKLVLSKKETAHACRLMAMLEKAEHQAPETAEKWHIRSQHASDDPAWVCKHCHTPTHDWDTNCNACGAFDSLVWDQPHGTVDVIPPRMDLLPYESEA